MSRGKIIAIEGTECAGKSTLFKNVQVVTTSKEAVFLPEVALAVAGRHFPLGTSANTETEVALLAKTCANMELTSGYSKAGRVVILDRCWISQIVYSSVRKELLPEYQFDPSIFCLLESVFRRLYPEVIESMLVVFLEISPATSLNRWRNRDLGPDLCHFPTLEWVDCSYRKYKEYLFNLKSSFIIPKVVEIDGAQAISDVLAEFIQACNSFGIPEL